jgi:DNA invertase Pin-like site-specific DNA recombinase
MPTEAKLRLIAYTRTSSVNGSNGDSLDAQEDACRSWATENGHEVVAVQSDPGVSGRKSVDERPGLLAALVAIEAGEADGIIVHNIDRLARELHVQEAALDRVWRAGGSVFETFDGEIPRDDPDDPQRTFLRQVLGAAAQLERGMIAARLRRGKRRKAATGGYIGGHRLHRRYGYQLIDGEYAPDPGEQETISEMRLLREQGFKLREICGVLEKLGRPSPTGKGWSEPTVHRILKRP